MKDREVKMSESKEVKRDGQVWGLLAGEWLRAWAVEPDHPGSKSWLSHLQLYDQGKHLTLWASVSP